MVEASRFDVCLINLDPTVGVEIKKTRPCLVISPDSMNLSKLRSVIIAPMTTTIRPNFPTRITTKFAGKTADIALDQLRSLDKSRVIKKLGSIGSKTQQTVLQVLQELFVA